MRAVRLFGGVKLVAFPAGLVGAMLFSSFAQAQDFPVSSPMPVGPPTFAPRGFVQFCERRPDQCGLPSPMPYGERMALDQMINRQQWAAIFQLKPASIHAPAASGAPGEARTETTTFGDGGVLDVVAADPPDPVSPPAPLSAPAPARAAIPSIAAVSPSIIAINEWTWGELNRINRSINSRIRPMSDEDAFGVSDFWTLPLSDGPRPVGNCKHYVLEKRKALVEAGVPPSALSIAILRTDGGEIHAVLIVATERGDFVLDNLTTDIRGWREANYAWLSRQIPGRPLEWASIGEGLAGRFYF